MRLYAHFGRMMNVSDKSGTDKPQFGNICKRWTKQTNQQLVRTLWFYITKPCNKSRISQKRYS